PYGIAGRGRINVIVTYKGVPSVAYPVTVVDISPGIYTLDSNCTTSGSGRGQGAIFNELNYRINCFNNPEVAGHYIAIYATGEGLTTPRGLDGAVNPTLLAAVPKPVGAVGVIIGGIPVPASDIAYAGEAPGLLQGVLQINAKIPASLGTGPQP